MRRVTWMMNENYIYIYMIRGNLTTWKTIPSLLPLKHSEVQIPRYAGQLLLRMDVFRLPAQGFPISVVARGLVRTSTTSSSISIIAATNKVTATNTVTVLMTTVTTAGFLPVVKELQLQHLISSRALYSHTMSTSGTGPRFLSKRRRG